MTTADCGCDTFAIGIPGPPGKPGADGPPGDPGPAGPPGSGSEIVALSATAGVNLSGHRAVYRRPDGLIDYASADDPALMSVPVWITTGAVLEGSPITVVELGEIDEPSWSWTPGAPIFLGIGGALTQTPPAAPGSAFSAVLGYASTPTTMYVDRQPSIALTT